MQWQVHKKVVWMCFCYKALKVGVTKNHALHVNSFLGGGKIQSQQRMYRHFTAQGTRMYLSALPALVDGYKGSRHLSVSMALKNVKVATECKCGDDFIGNAVEAKRDCV